MATVASHPDFAGILRDEERYAVENDPSVENQLNSWIDNLVIQSGTGLTPSLLMGLSFLCGVTLGGIVFVLQENPLTAALGAVIGFAVPIVGLSIWRSNRQRLMNDQLPGMIDELARAAKTGRSLEHCLTLVANDTANPLGAELRNCTRKLALGLTVGESLRELPQRTGLVSTSILATALSVHSESGGDLVPVLERLAHTLRDRIAYTGRLNAATSASRATAILMIVLPPAILAFFMFRDPNYLTNLFDTVWGTRLTVAAFILEFIGALWVLRILQTSRQN